MFFAQVIKQRGLPFRPSEFPALEEYDATLEQAVMAEREARAELVSDRKSGRLVEFKGKLP
jgi:hypothetical protein